MSFIFRGLLAGLAAAALLALPLAPVLAVTSPQVVTYGASSVQNTSAVLNGNLSNLGGDYSAMVWFQWGTSTSYGYETSHYSQNFQGNFSQQINSLAPNTIFHYRAVAQNSYSTVYGQDMTFTTGYGGGGQLVVNAGSDQYLQSNQQITLQGSAYDPNGGSVNLSWTCTGGSLNNYNVAQPLYTAPYVSGSATYTCTLTANSNSGYSNSDSVAIYVNSGYVGGNVSVQTNQATNIYSNQATLNGYLQLSGNFGSTNVWFQWGTGTNYGNETNHQQVSYTGSFSQNISGLYNNTTYHFRAVAQGNSGQLVYGQDMTFTTGSGGGNYYGTLNVQKSVMNLSSGSLGWASSVAANPFDILRFTVTLQNTGGQDVHNVVVRDSMPNGLIYNNNLQISGSANYYGSDVTSGITFNTIGAGQYVTITYQAQVASAGNFGYGQTTLNNSVTVTGNEIGQTTRSASVIINRSLVAGATSVSTGLTDNLWTDSFFLPLLLLLLGIWFYASGAAAMAMRWVKNRW